MPEKASWGCSWLFGQPFGLFRRKGPRKAKVLAVTVRLPADMARAAIPGFKAPETAKGIARKL